MNLFLVPVSMSRIIFITDLLLLVLSTCSSSDVSEFTNTSGYSFTPQYPEIEETGPSDYSEEASYPIVNVSQEDMADNGTTSAHSPSTTDKPSSATHEPATTAYSNVTGHPEASTMSTTPTTTTTERETTTGMITTGTVTTEMTTSDAMTTKMTTSDAMTTKMTTTDIPVSHVQKFSLKSGSSYCFLFQSNIMFRISYRSQNRIVKSYEFTVSNATVNNNESACTEKYTKLSLTFTPNERNEEHEWKLVFLLNRIESNKTSIGATTIPSFYSLNNILLTYYLDKDLFPDLLTPGHYVNVSGNTTVFEIPVGSYYSCTTVPDISLTGNEEIPNSFKVYMKNLKVEAFMNNSVEAFLGNETLCDSDVSVNNMVPIGVGVALIICIVVAVTVFIVFNRRNRRSYATL
ncbi:unnamed protein product [Schistosoma turkestanicum]|nr:unnamed protein product [Schistosoma turkestanicum]